MYLSARSWEISPSEFWAMTMQEWFVEYHWRANMNKKKVGSFDSDEERDELIEWALNGD